MAVTILDRLPEYHFTNQDNFSNPEIVKWTHNNPPPPIGAEIYVRMNGLGISKVLGYVIMHGFLGLYIQVEHAPLWFSRQTSGENKGVVFGPEIA